MKCQRKASPYSACLRSRSCARFSPTTSMPASTSTAMSGSETYFVAATTVTWPPMSPRIRSYAARTASGDVADHSLPTSDAAVAAVREEVAAAGRADVDALDRRDARVVQNAFGDGPEIEVAAANGGGAEPCAVGVGDVLADLVATRPDARTDRGGEARAAQGCGTRFEDALEQPEPAGVQQGERRAAVAARERDGEAVRCELQHRHAWFVRPQAVALPPTLPGDRAVHGRGVHLAVHRERLGVGVDRRAQPPPVLVRVL